jgi:hypothetical protein
MLYFLFSKSEGEISQCWCDEIIALVVFRLHLDIRLLPQESNKWKLKYWQWQHYSVSSILWGSNMNFKGRQQMRV